MIERRTQWWVVPVALALSAAACTGDISEAPGLGGGAHGGPGGGGGGNAGEGPEPIPPADADVGRVAIHRLNSLEYDNTIRDLLGVTSNARATFMSDESGDFDNTADNFTVNDARY